MTELATGAVTTTGADPVARERTARLRALAQQGAAELGEHATAHDVLAWAARTFDAKLAVASNMQDAALIHLAGQARPGVDVLFLDTGYHFAETIGTRDAVEATMPVRIVNLRADRTVAQQDAAEGRNLFAREPDRCCALRKVAPLRQGLRGYDAWVTGVRRVEAPTRANTPLVTFDERNDLVKINPIAAWSDDELAGYIEDNQILVNPLVAEGYPSIGCEPCTAKPLPGADPRSGRWAGIAKTECGLHA
jgi:phosphoadenosine phosphosulfate reductase